VRESVKRLVSSILPDLSRKIDHDIPSDFVYEIETPKNKTFGDFSVNLALKLAKATGKNPRQIATAAKEIIDSKAGTFPFLKKSQVDGPGFINFFLTEESRADVLTSIKKQDEHFGESDYGKGQKVIVEFVSANPTGPLTIAHGRQAAVGDTLANILKTAGFQVQKEFYLNDAGRQVDLLGKSVLVRLKERIPFPVTFPVKFPEDGYHGEYVKEIAKQVSIVSPDLDLDDPESLKKITIFAANRLLEGIKLDLEGLGVRFDQYYSENSLYQNKFVEKVIKELSTRNNIYESEGALWFKSTDFGDDKDRVLKRSNGEYTYFTPDIAYHQTKFERGFDLLINLWGPDHHGYIPRVKAACAALGYSPDKLEVLIVQLVTLYRRGEQVRMSKRAGEYVTLKELMEEVGADATRFFFLMRRVESPLDFDLELAKEKSQDNPVYYLQYAHARICSMVEYAKRKLNPDADITCLIAKEEVALLQALGEYPELIKQAARLREPYRVVEYLRELAAAFHSFYGACRVVSDDEKVTDARLLLTDCVRIVLRNGLRILGVSQPESM